MAANYAKIDRVGSLDAGFQQVPLVQNSWNFHNIVLEHPSFKIWKKQKKQKKNKTKQNKKQKTKKNIP